MTCKLMACILTLCGIVLANIVSILGQTDVMDGKCSEAQQDESCIQIRIDPSNYDGFYQVIDPNDAVTATVFHQRTKDLWLKRDYAYVLVVGDSSNRLPFTLNSDGRVTAENSIALDTSVDGVLRFNTTKVFIDPGNYVHEYYLYNYRPNPLFQAEGFCSFSRDKPAVLNAVNCPKFRDSKTPLNLVPTLRYVIEPYGVGYPDKQVIFQIGSTGEVSVLTKSFAARGVGNSFKFLNVAVGVTSVDYDGTLAFGYVLEPFRAKQTRTIWMIPYLPSIVGLKGPQNGQFLIATTSRSIPAELTFEVPGTQGRLARFKVK